MNDLLKEQLSGKKILIATVSADGHVNPLTGLARFLADLGCDLRWYTSEIFSNKLKKLGIPHYPVVKAADVNTITYHNMYPERGAITDMGERANFDMIHILIKPGPGQFQDIQDIQKHFPFEVIITDSLFPALPYISAKMGVPVMSIGIIPLPESSKDLGPYGPGYYPPSNDEERHKFAELRQIFEDVVYKPATECLSSLLTESEIPHQPSSLFDTLTKSPDLYLQIGSPSFEYPRSDFGENIRFIGSLLPYANQDEETQWTDRRLKTYEKAVLVTQGTVETDVTKIIEPVLEALKGTDILVIATTGGRDTEELRKKFPFDNLIIEDYLPFDQVMPLVDVYITNGGYSGTLLAIKHKLPIISAGLHEGKAEVCSRIGYFNLGIDLKVERPAPADIRNALDEIFSNPQYKHNITKLSQEMYTYNPKERCAMYLVELLNKDEVLSA
jgi:UDP:flavonoid glycosyltransferase YjiC (YdhE family)